MTETRAISWIIAEADGGLQVSFAGEINEKFDPQSLLDDLRLARPASVDLVCEEIRRLNSEGIRRWVGFVRELAQISGLDTVTYSRCSVAVVAQINMIPAMLEHTSVRSLFAPYACAGEEQDMLIEVASLQDPLDPPEFPDQSGDTWEFDEDPSRYFAFLLDAFDHVAAPRR